ncbi:hypothetical protein H0H93_004940 [Arthromyces matolae]|nr:hypothetical protein H0H93_004940 [Arthromyces matolae]
MDNSNHHAFDLDDAFSDGDLNDLASQFSPEDIREDIARHMPTIDPPWTTNGVFGHQNLSVSTLDIDPHSAQASISSFPSPPQTPHPLSPELSDQFSQISLDNEIEKSREQLASSLPDDPVDGEHTIISLMMSNSNRVPSPLEQSDDQRGQPTTPESSHSEFPPDSAYSTQSLPPPDAPQPSPAAPRPLSAAPSTVVPAASETPSTSIPVSLPQAKQKGHRPTRSTSGPSAFEKVRSKTRPLHLPPKPRQEDQKHLADWHSMMKTSRAAAAEKKREALLERRLAREKAIQASLPIWEKEIVPDWRIVNNNAYLRKFWWKGIPTKLRASMWEHHYRISLSRAKKALNSNMFPRDVLDTIEQDISTTLPSLHIFHPKTGPLYEELKDMLCAWVVTRSDEGLGYTPGVARIAAMILINMPVQQGFVTMRNLLDRHCLRSFYGGEGTREDHQIVPSAYLKDWLLPLFLDHLPFEACARIWDVLILEGDAFLYRASLAILAVLEPRLFFPESKELMDLLRGENRAALEVAKREGRRLDGGKYEAYGVDEETVWEFIDQMDEWWKESTWTRLLQRELPDV